MNKRGVGKHYEGVARRFIEQSGYHYVESNYLCPYGEIDIIAWDGDVLCFIEVKYRSNLLYGYPSEAVTSTKQFHLRQTASYYRRGKHYGFEYSYRFDIVEIVGNQIRIIKNAFT